MSIDKWIHVGDARPTDSKGLYWVVSKDTGRKPIIARFNDYRSMGGATNYWQTLAHDDFSMINSIWMKVKEPEAPKNLPKAN